MFRKSTPNIGLNLASPSDFSPIQPFADLFKCSRSPQGYLEETEQYVEDYPFETTTNGFPAYLPEGVQWLTYCVWNMRDQYWSGDYVLTWKGGQGNDVDVQFANVLDKSHERIVLNKPTEDELGFQIWITKVDPDDPIREMSLRFVGSPRTQIYSPPFFNSLKPFKTLRFMDWQMTNGSTVTDKPFGNLNAASYSVHPNGVPTQLIARLVQLNGADPWICIPHLATDEAIRALAEFWVKALPPNQKIYVELSNEYWNAIFTQNEWFTDEGYGSPDAGYARHATRAMATFEDVFTRNSRRHSLIRVVGVQTAALGRELQIWADLPSGTRPIDHFDAIAVAPYFGHDAHHLEQITVDNVLNATFKKYLPELFKQLNYWKKQADMFGLKLIGYEGGPHFVSVDPEATEVFKTVNRHPRLGRATALLLERWAKLTPEPLCWYNGPVDRWGIPGCWGIAESYKENSPKKSAICP